MALLVAGLVIFFSAHLLPSVPSVRNGARDRLGVNPYMGLFSLVSLGAFVLIVLGVRSAPYVHVYDPPVWGRSVAIYAMPVALTLFVGAYMPSNLKRFLRHPMLLGVLVWATVHLLSNGDRTSIVLFGSFAAFSLFDIVSANVRGATRSDRRLPVWRDVALVAVGAVLYVGLLHGHGWLFGMPAIAIGG